MAAEPGRPGVAVGGRRWVLILVAGAAVALLVGRSVAEIYTDYLWYGALGFPDIWRARYGALVALRLLCTTAATLFVFANLYAVRQSVVSLVLPRRVGNLDIGEEVPRRQLTWTAAVLSLLIGVILAWSQSDWSAFLGARIGQRFNESDPYFAADLGFFVYRLPFELSLFTWSMTVVLIVIGIVALLYALTPSLRWEQGGLYVSGYVRRHFAVLAGVLLVLLAWHYRLSMYTLLGAGSAADGAFTYLDHRVGIPASLLLALVTLGAGLTVMWAGWTGQLRLAFAALTGVIVAVLMARQVAPFIAKRTGAAREPALRERPYEGTRLGYTRRAFAVDQVTTADLSTTFATLPEAAQFVPVWDEGALRRAADRPLPGSDVGWVAADSGIAASVPTLGGGGSVATFLASATDENGVPARVLRADADDMPRVWIAADSAPRSQIVTDSSGHIAAPSLGPALSRIAHALSMQDFRVWFGVVPAPNRKLITRGNVRDRVRALAPFFAQGTSVVPLWHADSLVWALDLYSSSATYPLSRKIMVAGHERAYFQHAATALVNATTGRTALVADSIPDPVAASWIARFPNLFRRASAIPVALRRQLPPARDGALAQAAAYGRVGGSRTEAEVVRHLPDDLGADSALADTPPPFFALPQSGGTAYALPLLDPSERLRGVFIAQGGTTRRSVWVPAPESAPLWNEVIDRLGLADTVPASLLVRGYVRAIPVGGEIVLVQPRYDWRGSGPPRLLYVAALAADSVRSARTLLQLAGRLPTALVLGSGDIRSRARELYDEMRRAAERGDWAGFGRAFDALGALLRDRRPPP